MLNQYTLNGGKKRGRVNTQDIWRYNEWTSFAGVERLFWRSICPVLVLFHRTYWAVHIYKACFLKCHFLPVSLLSLLPTIMDGVYLALQNYILNSLLGYSSCRYPKLNIYSTELIISLSKLASLPVFLISCGNVKSSLNRSSTPTPNQSLSAFYSLSRSLCILSSPLHSHRHDHFITGSLLSVSLLCISSSRKQPSYFCKT